MSVKRNVVNPNGLILYFEECVGRGCWKKRKHDCNDCDRTVLLIYNTNTDISNSKECRLPAGLEDREILESLELVEMLDK